MILENVIFVGDCSLKNMHNFLSCVFVTADVSCGFWFFSAVKDTYYYF